MDELKMECEKCGADVLFRADETLLLCKYCQTQLVRPRSQGEPLRMLERANELWANCRFAEAEKLYHAVLAMNPDEYEARWKLLLCKYGVKYVREQPTGAEYIICMRAQASSLRNEPEYHEACQLANDPAIVAKYEQDAAYIDGVQAQIRQLKLQEDRPYEVFICFKDKDDQTRERTPDSIYAESLYRRLSDLGYRVFYSPISMADKAGENYEAEIFRAIETAKVMLVVGTRRDYFEASWVRSEWERFLQLRADSAPEKTLIPLFLGNELTLPKVFTNLYLQGIDLESDYLVKVEQRLDHLLRKAARDKRKMEALQEELARLQAKLQEQQQAPAPAVQAATQPQAAAPQPASQTLPPEDALSYTDETYFEVIPDAAGGVIVTNYVGAEAEIRIPPVIGGKPVRAIRGAYDTQTNRHRGFTQNDKLTSVVIPDGVTRIDDYAFTKCSNLSHVVIPSTVTWIGQEAFMFTELAEVKLPESLQVIGDRAFSSCSLKEAELPDSLESLGVGAFEDCYELTRVALPDRLTAIREKTFHGCGNLDDVVLPPSVTSIGDEAFYGCDSLTTMVIPPNVTSIGHDAFFSCNRLTSVVFPPSMTSIGDSAFYGCRSLASVEIPSSMTSIGVLVFAHCKSLTSVEIPSSVTTIDNWAFYKCRALEAVTLPATLTSIGKEAFAGCNRLQRITIPDSVVSIGKAAFDRDLTIHCSRHSYAASWVKWPRKRPEFTD